MGGSVSHEFHYPSDIGEDIIRKCTKCSYSFNIQLKQNEIKCLRCGCEEFTEQKTVEVGSLEKKSFSFS